MSSQICNDYYTLAAESYAAARAAIESNDTKYMPASLPAVLLTKLVSLASFAQTRLHNLRSSPGPYAGRILFDGRPSKCNNETLSGCYTPDIDLGPGGGGRV